MSARQGVLAIVYEVVSALPKEQQPPRNLNIKWALGTESIEQRYQRQFSVANELACCYRKSGISLIILKGLGLACYYPIPNHRECGDIDIYLTAQDDTNILDIRSKRESGHSYYKHDSFYYNGTCVERHNYFTSFRGNGEIKWFENLLHKHIDVMSEYSQLGDTLLYVPNPTVNALFLAYHSINHFLIEGITIRHLLDWGLFIKQEQNNIDWHYFYEVCDRMRYSKFIDTINGILVNKLGFVFDNAAIHTESQYGIQVVNDILFRQNRHVSGITTWKRRYMVVRNIIQSRWKYNKIYQHNFFVAMAKSAWGIIFDKEAKL